MNDLESLNSALDELTRNDAEFKNEILQNPVLFKRLLQAVAVDELKEEIKKSKIINSYDYEELKLHFLNMFSSKETRKAYNAALKKLEEFIFPQAARSGKNESEIKKALSYKIFSLSPLEADLFIESLNKKYSSLTVIRDTGAVSSFYAFFERLTQNKILNPLRGTRSRPKKKALCRGRFFASEIVTPEKLLAVESDIKTIIENVSCRNMKLKACILIMAYRGLRAGSFENLKTDYVNFMTITKGKKIEGVFPSDLTEKLKALSKGKKIDFSTLRAERLESLFKYYTSRLYSAGLIKYKYSCHDMRHFYALKNYLETKDIYRVSKLLFHTSVNVTENYLKGLNVNIDFQ